MEANGFYFVVENFKYFLQIDYKERIYVWVSDWLKYIC